MELLNASTITYGEKPYHQYKFDSCPDHLMPNGIKMEIEIFHTTLKQKTTLSEPQPSWSDVAGRKT